jgi:hypothetical protein
MVEWFYVKNDLEAREDIKEIIQCPIWSCFGLRRPKVEIDGNVEACQKAFSTVCAFIRMRDLIQEHIAFRVWPLVESWDMPKETTTDSNEGVSHPALRDKARCISYMRQEDNIYNNRVYRDKCHKTSEYLLHSGSLITK